MDKSEKYVVKMESQLKEWDAELEKLAAAGEKKAGQALDAYVAAIKGLRTERDQAHQTFLRMRAATHESGRQLQSQMRVTWDTMQKALEKATAELRK